MIWQFTNKNALAFINISVPISNWWGGSLKTKQNRLEIEKAQSSLEETDELLQLQIVQTNNELNESLYQIQLFQKSVDQAKENLQISQANYKAGNIGISDLLEAQALCQSALDNLTHVICNVQIKKAKYLKAKGNYKLRS